jgi:excisionase family DNA binding protein
MALLSVRAYSRSRHLRASTVHGWIREGRIAGYRVGQRLVRVDEDEVDAFIRRHRVSPGTGNAAPLAAKGVER